MRWYLIDMKEKQSKTFKQSKAKQNKYGNI